MGSVRIFLFVLLCSNILIGQSKPNIILIMADDMGHGEISFNHTFGSTPILDSLARGGAYLNQFYATTICTASRASLLSGKYAHKIGLDASVIWVWEDRAIDSGLKLLPEMLKEEGYQTAIFGKWHLGHAQPKDLPMSHGFDHYRGFPIGAIYYYSKLSTKGPFAYQQNGRLLVGNTDYMTTDLGQNAAIWAEQQLADATCPFFLYLAFAAPHDPYESPSDLFNASPPEYVTNSRHIWAMNKEMDNQIGAVWQKVVEAGQEENTIIIFLSDNGDHRVGSNYPFGGFKASLWEGSIRSPFIWYHKGRVAANRKIDGISHITDIYRTIQEGVLGVINTDTLDGRNLYPILYGSGEMDTNRVVITKLHPGRMWSIHKGRWKLVKNKNLSVHDSTAVAGGVQLFDVISDPTESKDLYHIETVIRDELQALLDNEKLIYPRANSWNSTKPDGWIDFFGIAYPHMYYHSSYYYYKGD